MKLKIINNGLKIEKTDFHDCRGELYGIKHESKDTRK
ncbi:hypothetical protein BCM20_005875 [Clostridium beijerinckii]|uniref:Uncharacterized protein n=1 Tax=Clostridium beijerinckii TaxID=1520 RepID=A0AAX0BAC2_CLOBE|nr:hypothetical protein [Clostridium beijerinckii]NRT74347.1 hypothetical protein [Clostridium beijerinckii]NRT92387.1 hypothetical protein [Clostridium beijerinckii]NYC05778.1 hypothetical protein [Clostridium beijerinckii]NYC75620.1 hypothetical protein [Clostridium beijerinckii]